MNDFLRLLTEVQHADPIDYTWLIEQNRANVELENLLTAINLTNLAAENRDRLNNPHMASFYDALARARSEGTNNALRL